MAIYERHRPESTVLYQSVARAWPKIEIEYAINDQSIAPHVTAEFERYKRCGILEHGFLRLYCKDCQAERVIGLNCNSYYTPLLFVLKMLLSSGSYMYRPTSS